MNLLVGLREPKSTGDASHLGVVWSISSTCASHRWLVYFNFWILAVGPTWPTYMNAVVLQMMRCIFRVWCLSQTQKTMCARAHTHTENYDGSCPFSIPFIYIFCCFLLSNSSNCCSRGTIFGAGALRLHPTKENTAEHLTKQGLCWR